MNIQFTVKKSPDFKIGEHISSLPKEVRRPVKTMQEYKDRNGVPRAAVHGNGVTS